jgi:CheY-like chemotaxis protein
MARILVADDSAYVLDVARRCLEGAGHDVMVAEDGAQAIEIGRRCQPELAIVDLMMPVMDGSETIRELRGMDHSARIIAMSGALAIGGHDPLAVAARLGAQTMLLKPFALAALLDAVERTLNPLKAGRPRAATRPGRPLRVRFEDGSAVLRMTVAPLLSRQSPSWLN